MIPPFKPSKLFRALAVFSAFALAAVANAQLKYTVMIDTSSLVGSLDGPFSLDFQLNDGSGFGNGSNAATLNNFQFGGGAALGSANTFGGATGDLLSGVTLTDTDPLLNEFYQTFTAGSWLSFDLTLTTNVEAGGTPDIFSFALLDGSTVNVPTKSLGSDMFLEINVTGPSPSIATFASVNDVISAPSISAVPEPSTYALWAGGMMALAVTSRRIRRTPAAGI